MIRTKPVIHCPICDGQGEILYVDLQDRLFDAPGVWQIQRCTSSQCEMLWLDPAPIEEDIHLAYRKYYTHQDTEVAKIPPGRAAWQGYRSLVFGNERFPATLWQKLLGLSFFVLPNRKPAVEYPVRQLEGMAVGDLLEIGCGAGDMLRSLKDMGWQAVGIDFDENAVLAAQRKGLDVRVGDLDRQRFPDSCFDVILMNHVIEHLPDPISTLLEINRILRPGGRLVGITPNAKSWGHKYFKQDWQALHPPQHLQIFTKASLCGAIERAQFDNVSVIVSTMTAIAILKESVKLQRGARKSGFIAGRIALEGVWLWEWILTILGREAGELLVFCCRKK